jgi:hypothetical protein
MSEKNTWSENDADNAFLRLVICGAQPFWIELGVGYVQCLYLKEIRDLLKSQFAIKEDTE